MQVKEVTVQELKSMMDGNEDFQLVDVREPHEIEICNIGGDSIPLNTVMHNSDKFAADKKVVIHCRSGARSANAVMLLQAQNGMENLYNLKGGILAWADEIDNSLTKY